MKNVKELLNQNVVAASALAGFGIYASGMMGYGLNSTIGLSQTLTYTATWLVNQVIGSFAPTAAQTMAGMMLAGATAAIATAFTAWFISKAINLAMAKFAPAAQQVEGDKLPGQVLSVLPSA
jgi:hypothetical protein